MKRLALIVDDDSPTRFMVANILIQLGYHVTEAGNAQEALTVLAAEGPIFDLVVTDYQMPGASGVDLIRKILADTAPSPRILLFTAMPLDLEPIKSLRAEVEGKFPVAFASKGAALKTMFASFRKITDKENS